MEIVVLGRENDIVAIPHASIERHPGEHFGGLVLHLQTRDGREHRLRITSEAVATLAKALEGYGSMLGLPSKNPAA